MLNGIAEMAKKIKKEKEQKMLEKIINVLIEAEQDGIKGVLSTEHAMLLLNEILTLREVNEILVNENEVLREENIGKRLMIDKLEADNISVLERIEWVLKGAERCAKIAEDAKRTIRLEERKKVNCPKDIMQVYGYRE
jgi:hypothetical protein